MALIASWDMAYLCKKQWMKWLVHAAPAVCLFLAPHAQAGTIYVTTNGTDAAGANWTTPTSLTNALVIATAIDQIWVADGTYSNTATFTVPANRFVYGGFTNGMATFGERNWTNYPAILDGHAANRRVVTVSGTNVTLDGLVISNSFGNAAGGIDKSSAGLLTLANCRIVKHMRNSSPCGAGLYINNASASVLLTNCVVSGNSTTNTLNASGYGILANSVSTLDIVDCQVTGNIPLDADPFGSRDGRGGAVRFVPAGTLRVVRTEFINNRGASQFLGGAIHVDNASSTLLVSNCVFSGNSVASGGGGAISVGNGSATIVNCTFWTNIASSGGAVYLGAGTLNLRNSILWTNRLYSGSSGSEIYQAGGTLNARYNAIAGGRVLPYIMIAGGSTTYANNMTNNPLFASAADLHVQSPAGRWESGGFVTTDSLYSPCIDAGDPADSVGLEVSENGSRRNLGAYGGLAQASKSPNEVPLVTNRPVLTNSYTQMILRGELTNDAPVIATVLICYGTNSISEPTTSGWEYVSQVYPPQQTGVVFTVTTPYLVTNKTYYYRAYATNAYGTNWAAVESFVTDTSYPPGWGVGGGSDVIHVKAGAVGEADGRDWFNAYTTIGAGIAAISGSRTNIWITGGTYNEGQVFTLANACKIIGGFQGTENAVSERSLTNTLGVVTNYTAINGENSYRCISVTAAGTVWLDTLVCSNSPYNVSGALGKSGSGLLVMNNCRLEKNRAGTSGGGGYFSAGSVLMTNCVVADNKATGGVNDKGFGLLIQNTVVDIVDCLVTNNVPLNAWNSRDRYGGGIAFESGTLRVLRTDFIGNQCADQGWGGGGAYIAGRAAFSNCMFRANRATASSSGAGLYINAGTYTANVVNCTFAYNTNGAYGGAIRMDSGTLNLKNCILWTNGAASSGGEIYFSGGTATVSYCDFTGTNSPYVVTNTALVNWGMGIITEDPLYASATDLHLRSRAGRWDPEGMDWVIDPVTSPCIDAGDPDDQVGAEPFPNARRINLGAYGGTVQASRTLLGGTVLILR